MEKPLLMLFFLLAVANYLAQGILASASSQDEKLVVKRQLERLNKPANHSFVTKHGDIMDCVEIDKQLAFDHPLLINHSIQMKPSFKITKRKRLNDNSSSILTASQLLPKNTRCPNGTVLIKRIQEEDLAMAKYSKLFRAALSNSSFSSKFVFHNSGPPQQVVQEIATLRTSTQNTGTASLINLWSPKVNSEQYSAVCLYVRNGDDSVTNAIVTGWMVNTYLYSKYTRLYTYWTSDNSKSTGCYNTLCPGFVQTSQHITLGQILSPISKYMGQQYYVDLTLRQDEKTKNWWLLFKEEQVGYWPKELFNSLANGADKAGWGGEISSVVNKEFPGMGSGHFPEDNYKVACLMRNLKLFAPDGFPSMKDLYYYLSKPKCYRSLYGRYRLNDLPPEDDWGHFVFVGGPPNCTA